MSIIGVIQVYKCDSCHTVAIVHTEEDEASFRANWIGLGQHFCPDCKAKVENAAAIEHELAAINRIDEMCRRTVAEIDPHSAFRDPHSKKEVANV